MVLRVRFLLLYMTFLGCNPPDMKDVQTGRVSGEKIYKYYCISCHGKKGDLQAGNASDLSVSILSDEAIRKMILEGSDKGMNSYSSIFNKEEELEALVSHVKTLRK